MTNKKASMKIKFQKTISALVGFALIMSTQTKCFSLDMTHDYHEELELLSDEIVYRKCWSQDDDRCEKYLVRYEGVKSVIEQLKNLIEENSDCSDKKAILQKLGIGATGVAGTGVGLYFSPIRTSIVILSVVTALQSICIAHRDVLGPAGKTVSLFTKALLKLKKWLLKERSISSPDKGLIGNTLDVLCGDESRENYNYGLLEGMRRLIFGESAKEPVEKCKKKEIYSRVLKDMHKKINSRAYEGNNMIIISMDFADLTNVSSMVNFDKTQINLNYEKPLEEYFKDIKI